MRIPRARCALVAMLVMGMALLGPVVPGGEVGAATVNVPCDVAALIAAVGNAANDVINLQAGCTYTLTTVNNTTDGANGLPVIDRTLTINGNGAIIERSSAGGTPQFRLIEVVGGGDLTLNALTLRGGRAVDSTGFQGASAGGGLRNLGTLTLVDSTVSGNTAGNNPTGTYGGYGGGIFNRGTLTLLRSTASGNAAGNGVNYGGCGGAIDTEDGSVALINSTLSGNTAPQCGGAMNTARTATTIINSTITGNNVSDATYSGGGISVFFTTVNLTNTIIAGNTSTEAETADCFVYGIDSSIASGGHNLVGSGTGCPSGGTGDLTVAPADVFTTVLSATLAPNGGPTQTHALLAGSPALNAADDVVCAETGAGKVNGVDQRGVSRPQGVRCDIGAYERDAVPTVTINQAAGQDDPADASPVHFTVVFNEPVTGFGNLPGDVTLGGTAGATTAVVTEIAPNNGTTYDVAVSGMTANGTVSASVPAGAAQDLQENTSLASTSTDNTVTFTLVVATQLDSVRGTLTYGDTTATLTARLRTLGGVPLAGQTVVFTLDGQQVCGVAGKPACPVTGAGGVATLGGVPVPAGLVARSYANRVCASFAGAGTYLPAGPTCGPLTVARKVLWLKPTDRTVGLRQPNPPTTPPAGCLAQQTATSACWLELANGSSFANGDDWGDLNLGALRFQYNRNPPSTNASEYVGKTYRITAFGAASGNYDIRYQQGTLTVVAAP